MSGYWSESIYKTNTKYERTADVGSTTKKHGLGTNNIEKYMLMHYIHYKSIISFWPLVSILVSSTGYFLYCKDHISVL